jgi:hypothetical protein
MDNAIRYDARARGAYLSDSQTGGDAQGRHRPTSELASVAIRTELVMLLRDSTAPPALRLRDERQRRPLQRGGRGDGTRRAVDCPLCCAGQARSAIDGTTGLNGALRPERQNARATV